MQLQQTLQQEELGHELVHNLKERRRCELRETGLGQGQHEVQLNDRGIDAIGHDIRNEQYLHNKTTYGHD